MAVTALFLFFLLGFVNACSEDDLTVNYYENVLQQGIFAAFSHIPPNNSYAYIPTDPKVKYYGNYDYIIVGAGSTGAVIATRLSEDGSKKILILEAGCNGSPFTDVPGAAPFGPFSDFNWAYKSAPQNSCFLGMKNNQGPIPRGKGLGGSSIINGLMYVRGNKKDFDYWRDLGNTGWSYKNVLRYFLKSENSQINGDYDYHGKDGYLNVEYHRPNSPYTDAFINANIELGQKYLDYNGREQLGVSHTQFTVLNGKRETTGKSFLAHAKNRKNLEILTESLVTKVLIDESKRAYGVRFSHNGQEFTATTEKEVILSAGAIGSPQILMLSGIGPAEHLQEHKIPVIQDLPVGDSLQDHPTYFGLYFSSNISEPAKSLNQNVKEFLNNYGYLTIAGNTQALGFYQTELAEVPGVPDMEFVFVSPNATFELTQRLFNLRDEIYAEWTKFDVPSTFTIYPILLHPKSSGTVRLASSNPYDYPLIDSRYFTDPAGKDIETMYQGILLALKMMDTEAFRKINAKLVPFHLPTCKEHEYLSREYWYCNIRHMALHIFHSMGTCRMGPKHSKKAVVNNKLQVHGISNLRVADASVFPATTSGHPNAVAIMIGEMVSDILKGRKIWM